MSRNARAAVIRPQRSRNYYHYILGITTRRIISERGTDTRENRIDNQNAELRLQDLGLAILYQAGILSGINNDNENSNNN